MNVELIDYQKNALDILIYTKNTRLQGELTLQDIANETMEWKMDHLNYMLDTIQSSWEFVDYTFEIQNVSRAFTHQLVRTRTASFAQESQRSVDISQKKHILPKTILNNPDALQEYERIWEAEQASYANLTIFYDIPRHDARNVIGTGVMTSIIVKANLRTLHNMGELRLCFKTQDEYQQVFREMKRKVVEVHPWAEKFIRVFCANHGTCAFPRYTECPIQKYTINQEHLKSIKEKILIEHGLTEHEATPKAVSGRTM